MRLRRGRGRRSWSLGGGCGCEFFFEKGGGGGADAVWMVGLSWRMRLLIRGMGSIVLGREGGDKADGGCTG